MFDKFDKTDLLDEAYEVYFKILSEAVREGRTEDPLKMVGLFLGLNIAENIMYQKLLDCGCTIEAIEKSKEKVSEISQDIIAKVRGKFIVSSGEDEV
tara:strand:- start:117 stop:407 length:291 start_codon:yes stop_codon:yes gene_type:complete